MADHLEPVLLSRDALVWPEGDEFIFITCPRVEVPDRLKELTIVCDLASIMRNVLTELATYRRSASK